MLETAKKTIPCTPISCQLNELSSTHPSEDAPASSFTSKSQMNIVTTIITLIRRRFYTQMLLHTDALTQSKAVETMHSYMLETAKKKYHAHLSHVS